MKITDLLESRFKRPASSVDFDEVSAQLTGERYDMPEWVVDALTNLSDNVNYNRALRTSKTATITPKQAEALGNYSGEMDGLDQNKIDRVVKLFAERSSITMPIVLANNKEYWLLAGNTRLSYNSSVLGKPTQVVLIDTANIS